MIHIQQRSGTDLFPVRQFNPLVKGTPASTVAGTYFDLEVDYVTTTSAWLDWQAEDHSTPEDGFTYENLTPDVCMVENWPLIERVDDGIGKVLMSNRGVTSTFSRNFSVKGDITTLAPTGFVSGTVGAASWEIIEPLVTTGGDVNLFESGFTGYNTDCWAAALDFTGVVFNNGAWNTAHKAGTAITRQHLLYAWHYQPSVGDTVKFMTADGTVITRTIIGMNRGPWQNFFNANPLVGDKCVVVLNAELPDEVKVYPIAGDWIYTRTTDDQGRDAYVEAWVGVKLDYERNVSVCGRTDVRPNLRYGTSGLVYGVPATDVMVEINYDWDALALPPFLSSYADYYQPTITGDSGSPAFYPLGGGDLALVCCASGERGGSFLSEAVLNGCIADADASASVSTGYTVTVAADPTI